MNEFGSPAAPPYLGAWRSRGYGWLLEVSTAGYSLWDITETSIALNERGDAEAFLCAYEVLEATPALLALRQRGDITTYWFDREESPQGLRPLKDGDRDPAWNLEVLWRHMQENYAFFELRGVDWNGSYARARTLIRAGMPDKDLSDLCLSMLTPLNDAHVSLDTGIPVPDATSPIRERKRQLESAFSVPPWMRDRQGYTNSLQAAFNELFLQGRGRTTSNNLIQYAELDAGVGYLNVFGEFGHADTPDARAALDLPRNRARGASFLAQEIEALGHSLDQALAALAKVRALIVDIRLNYGGYDRLALDIAGRFSATPAIAYRKKAYARGGFVGQQDIALTRCCAPFPQVPIYLLTSRQTASAGEILTLGFSALANVTRVGEATLGILSDNLYKKLPIGWELSLSNEIYTAPDGALYESVGIPPQVETPVFDAADVKGGFRRTVEFAQALALSRL